MNGGIIYSMEASVWLRCNFSLVIYRFSAIPVKTQDVFFRKWQDDFMFIWTCKGPRRTKMILKKTKVGVITQPNFTTFCKGIVIKTVWYWCKDRYVDHWQNRKSKNRQMCQGNLMGER